MNKTLRVKCPQCETVFFYYQSEWRPFCCERCKLIDLGHWFEESYRVPLKDSKGHEDYASETQNEEQEDYDDSYPIEDSDYE